MLHEFALIWLDLTSDGDVGWSNFIQRIAAYGQVKSLWIRIRRIQDSKTQISWKLPEQFPLSANLGFDLHIVIP